MLSIANYKDMQIKTTIRYHLIPVRMVITEKSTNNKCSRACGEKGTLLHCQRRCKLVEPLWKTGWRFHRKLKIELPYDPASPLLDIYLDKTINIIQKDISSLCSQQHYPQQPRCVCVCQLCSCVLLFATPWTVACQAPLSWDSPGKNTGVGCHFLLQGIFLTQESNPGLLHCRRILYSLSHQGRLAKTWKQPKCVSIDGKMHKGNVVHMYNGILLIRKNKIMPFAATRMQLEIITLQKEKDKYHMISLICGI